MQNIERNGPWADQKRSIAENSGILKILMQQISFFRVGVDNTLHPE